MKDYKKILEGVIDIISTTEKSDIGFANICTYIGENCPELKKSKNERIKKRILLSLEKDLMATKNSGCDTQDLEQCIAWLEKQGESSDQIHYWTEEEIEPIISDYLRGVEHYGGMIGRLRCLKPKSLEKQGTPAKLSDEEKKSFVKGVLSSCALSFINYLDAHSYEGKMCVSNLECEDIENAFHNAMWDRLHRYYCKYIEKQGEQKPVLDFKASNWYVSKVDGKIHDMTYNSTDKVEPKFKIGDVLCDKSCTTLNKNSQPNIKILDIRNGMYICNNCSFPISQQDEYELMTKKIEPQSAWSDEDDYNLQCMIAKVTSDIQKGNVGRNNELIDWLKSLKDRATWKPSEEQIHAFIQVYVWYSNNFTPSEALTSLYNDLKKL